ncbi:MAG: hypothetical protein ACLTW9_04965 [Enterocloster sp.]
MDNIITDYPARAREILYREEATGNPDGIPENDDTDDKRRQ